MELGEHFDFPRGSSAMRMRRFLFLFLVLWSCLQLAGLAQEQSASDGGRKIVRRVEPRYPEVARRMNVIGTVKVFAVVAADGTVKAVEPVGGSPLLVEVSTVAIKAWKYAPAAAESKELIELHFHP